MVQRERKLTQHWVELPVSFKFRTREIGHITYWGQFGLGLGLNLRATADDRWTTGTATIRVDPLWVEESVIVSGEIEYEDVPVEDEVALMRAAMIVGLGIEYNLSGKTALAGGGDVQQRPLQRGEQPEFRAGRRTRSTFGRGPDGYSPIRPSWKRTMRAMMDVDAGRKMIDNAILLSLGLLF